MSKSIIMRLDKIATALESRGMVKEAERIDILSNTIEAGINLRGFFQQLLRKLPRPSDVINKKILDVAKRILMGSEPVEKKEDRLVKLYADTYGEEPDPSRLRALEDQALKTLSTIYGGTGGPMHKEAFNVPDSVREFLEYLIAVMKVIPEEN